MITKKIGKKGLALLVLIVGASVLTSAAVFTYYMNTTSTHNVGRLWQIKDDSNGTMGNWREMGDDDLTFNTADMVGGDIEYFTFWCNLSGNSNANKNLYFDIVSDADNGVYLNITYNNAGNWTEVYDEGFVTFTPGDLKEFRYTVSLDDYSPSGNYITSLKLEKA
jgi:hypothetical protein